MLLPESSRERIRDDYNSDKELTVDEKTVVVHGTPFTIPPRVSNRNVSYVPFSESQSS